MSRNSLISTYNKKKGRNRTLYEAIIFLVVAVIVLSIIIGIIAVAREREANSINSRYIAQKAITADIRAEKNRIVYENAKLQEQIQLLEGRIETAERRAEDAERQIDVLEAINASQREKATYVPVIDILTEETPSKERLPDLPTNRYDYESYRKLTDPASEQYKLQQECVAEIDTGIRYYRQDGKKYYTAALGGAYGDQIGDAWKVTLNCGAEFYIIRGDYKHALPADPDDFGDYCKNYDEQPCINVIEFIVDLSITPKAVTEAGGFHGLKSFGGKYGDGGNIVKIEYLGRKWKP